MALIFPGKTICKICGHVIGTEDKIVAFSAFVANLADPLYFFDDAAFHADCFHAHPLAEAANQRWAEVRRHSPPVDRACSICGRLINDPDDIGGTGHLTDNPLEPAFEFNYRQYHLSCLPNWPELARLRKILQDLNCSGKWKGPALDALLRELPNPAFLRE